MPIHHRINIPPPPISGPYPGTPGFSLPPSLLVAGNGDNISGINTGNCYPSSSTSISRIGQSNGAAGHGGKRSRSRRSSETSSSTTTKKKRKSRHRPPHEPYRYVAICTQHVHARPELTPMLARISITDYRGNVLYDSFVRPTYDVQDYRSMTTGIKPEQLENAPPFAIVRSQVAECVRGKIIVGHSLWQHLSLLSLCHSALDTRDVALFLPFHRTLRAVNTIPLKTLVWHLMRRRIGMRYENSIENARAALDLFRSYEDPWENAIRSGSWPSALPPSSHRQFFN